MRFLSAIRCVFAGFLFLVPLAAMGQNAESQNLHAIFDREWERWMKQSPTWASDLGDYRYNDQWEDLSEEAVIRSHETDLAIRKELAAIDPGKLDEEDRLNLRLFLWNLDEGIAFHPHQQHLMAIDHMGGVQTLDTMADKLRFAQLKDYEDWCGRLEKLGVYVDQTIDRLKRGVNAGLTPPRMNMQRVPKQIERLLVKDAKASGFYQPFIKMPETIPQADQERVRDRARKAIDATVLPAYRRLLDYFTTDYLPACRQTIGCGDLPRGRELYALRAKSSTTTNLTPEQIHAIGLSEVKRLRQEASRIMKEVEFKGSYDEFLEFLDKDPRFRFASAEQMVTEYRATAKKIDGALGRLFGILPRIPYAVDPIQEGIAEGQTAAYYEPPSADGYRPGVFRVNTSHMEARRRYELEPLTLHEAVPGHHLQIALAMEHGELPKVRRYGAGYTAYVEGWGLYAESLGWELGLYKDPYSRFGALTYEMWRACRLVVDTGMHQMGWSRQQAIDYIKENAARGEADIIVEVDRYIAWPGQALAYKIGQMRFVELRQKAMRELGEQFDVRRFHDEILASGPVPLEVVNERIAAWVKRVKGK